MSVIGRPPSLKAIADRMGVSTSLVSKALSGRFGEGSGANPKTIAAIKAVAEELGYRKNYAAAALVSGRQNVIGAFVHGLGNPGSGITEDLVRGLSDGAVERGQRLMIRFFEKAEQFLAGLPEATPSLLDGIIVAGITHPELHGQLKGIEGNGVPIVRVHEDFNVREFQNVSVDHADMGRLATEHLLARGCRRIVHVGGQAARLAGFRDAMADSGRAVPPQDVFAARGFRHLEGEAAVVQFERAGVDYDGVVAQSDELAVGVMNALLRRGRSVPGQVKIVGMDNSPLCETSIVPLTSVSGEFYQRGLRAVRLLLDKIAGGAVESVRLPPTLHARASTVALPTVISPA
jgi:LacI family transcriptional regulator